VKKITLEDIAKQTGYSVSTVSRVLNGSNKIGSKTSSKILETARNLNYHSPRTRNANVTKNVLNIALLATGFHEGEFYVSFYHGLNKTAVENNIRLYLLGIINPEKQLPDIMRDIGMNQYDAAILYIPEFKRADYIDLLKNIPSNFPIISTALVENPVIPTVTFDGYSGGHLVAQHFYEKGYKKVGIINGNHQRPESLYRKNGFEDFIKYHSDMDLIWEFNGDFTYESGVEAFHHFNKLKIKPNAIFAGNDDMCNGFMEIAKKNNYKFPDDIAIVGYDNLSICKHNSPTISSVATDFELLGSTTMKSLREMIANPDEKNGILSFIPVTLAKRESS